MSVTPVGEPRALRIGLLTTSFPRWQGDGPGSFVLGFARALVARGHGVEVLAPEPAHPGDAPRWPGIHVRFVRYLRPRALARTFYGAGVPENLSRDPLAWPGLVTFPLALERAARRRVRHWDALVSHWALPCGLVAGSVAGHRPHLAVLHSADVHLLRRLPGRQVLASRIARGAGSLLFVSPPLRDEFLSWLPAAERETHRARTFVSPMGVDPSTFAGDARATARRALGLDAFTVLSMGRLVPIKGLEDAIVALEGRSDVEFVVAGDGPERERLARAARRRGVRTRFVGHVSGETKRSLLAAADTFVMPSRRLPTGRTEGTPAALLEAMEAGLPIVASEVGGIPSVVEHRRTGLLVPASSPRALKLAIDELASDPGLRASLASAARRAGSRYTWPVLGPRFEAMLRSPG